MSKSPFCDADGVPKSSFPKVDGHERYRVNDTWFSRATPNLWNTYTLHPDHCLKDFSWIDSRHGNGGITFQCMTCLYLSWCYRIKRSSCLNVDEHAGRGRDPSPNDSLVSALHSFSFSMKSNAVLRGSRFVDDQKTPFQATKRSKKSNDVLRVSRFVDAQKTRFQATKR